MEAVIRQVHFAYRQEKDGWHGGHSNYEVTATAQGLTLTPVRALHLEEETQELPGVQPPPSLRAELETGAPLVLGAAQVSRGDTRLSVDAPEGQVEADGHLALRHAAFVEHLRNSEQGVEQSWSFDAAPGGQGELRVSVPVKGLVHSGTSEQGLHFTDARTGMGFRYGHGTWVDAKGQRTAIRAEYSQGEIQLRVPEEVLASSAYPAVLDPVVSYEMLIDGQLVSADLAVRAFPVLAFNGTNYLVVWRDTRGTQYNLYGTRVSSTGAVLDTAGFVISSGPGNSADPQVGTNGTDFFVVWSQFHSETWVIRGTRITSAGVVSDVGGRRLSPSLGSQNWPHVASIGTEYLVTWYMSAADGYYNVYARRFSSTGDALDKADISIATGSNYDETTPVVAANSSVYLVAWSDERSGSSRVYATRVSTAGQVLDGVGGFPLSVNSLQYMQGLASNGKDFLAIWLDYRTSGSRDLYGTRVIATETTKEVVDASGLAVGTSASLNESFASVASNGTDYLAAWTAWNTSNSTFQNLGARVSSSAASGSAVLDTSALVLSANAGHKHPSVARAGTGYFVAWDGTSGATTELYSAWVSSAGAVSAGNGFPVTAISSIYQTEPVVASNKSNYLVVWTEQGGGLTRILGTRINRDGGVLDVPALVLAATSRERQSPAVSSNGTDYLVTWMDFRTGNWDIYGARVLGSGASSAAVLDANGFVVSSHDGFQNYPAVGSDKTDYFVVWRQDPNGRGDVYGARVSSATGQVLDTSGIAIATNAVEHYTPRVAFNGSDYLVVWAELQSATSWDIHGARVKRDGSVLDKNSIAISSLGAEQYEPDVASDGNGFFVVWTDYRTRTNYDIYGTRVSAEGAVLDGDGLALCTETVQEASPKVAFDGTNYVAAWADYRWDSLWDVYATRVTGSGTVETPNGFSVVYNARETEPFVSLASAGDQQSMVVFSRYDTEPNQGSRRIRGSFFSF
ncbi:hypothetical protein [Hyalangium versicolor]|uniref:hypothetical protein n=1 Tax=Hyalangium versicolor TaxID=2861190 RepID=UPI001CCA8933|nr:hypothetical protein [Hyalangium versicolor]